MAAASDSAAYPPPAANSSSQPRVARHRLVAGGVVGARHPTLRGPDPLDDHVEPTGAQDPVAGEDIEVTGARVLREVADASRAGHGARRGLPLPGEHPRQGGLASAVAPDQPDPVARPEAERRAPEQEPCAGAQLDVGGSDHGTTSLRKG